MTQPGRGKLATWCTALLVVTAVADVATRWVPLGAVTFRAWEAVSASPAPGGPFAANRRWAGRATGDLAVRCNRLDLRQFRPETFSTDSRGYRRTVPTLPGPPSIIVTGDSFIAGVGLNDEQTLPSVLAQRTNCGAYNAGAGDPRRLVALARSLGVTHGWVVEQYLERDEVPRIPVGQPVPPPRWSLDDWLRWCEWTPSRLRIAAERVCRRTENDWLQPNGRRSLAMSGPLRDGSRMLFFPEEFATTCRARPAPDIRYYPWRQAELRAAGLTLAVILLPNKYTVYAPLLAAPDPLAEHGREHLAALEQAVRAAGVPALDLTPALRAAAATALAQRQTIYHTDDTHWNALGVQAAAARLLATWPDVGR